VLGKQRFGEYGVLQSTVTMFAVVAVSGLGLTATRYLAALRSENRTRAGRVLGLTTVTGVIVGALLGGSVFVSGPWLATNTLAAPHLTGAMRICGVLVFLSALAGTQSGALGGLEAFRTLARVNAIASALAFPLPVIGAVYGGVEGAVWGLAASSLLQAGLLCYSVQSECRVFGIVPTLRGSLTEARMLLRFSVPAALSSALVPPVLWACNAILVNEPAGYLEMGVFNAANQWRVAILFIPTAVGQTVLPLLAQLHGSGDEDRYRRLLKWSLLGALAVSLAVAIPIGVLSPWIIGSYGRGFAGGVRVMLILMVSAPLMAVSNVIGQALASEGAMWLGFLLNVLWGAALIALSWTLREHGAVGLAVSSLAAYCLHSGVAVLLAYRRLQNVSRPSGNAVCSGGVIGDGDVG